MGEIVWFDRCSKTFPSIDEALASFGRTVDLVKPSAQYCLNNKLAEGYAAPGGLELVKVKAHTHPKLGPVVEVTHTATLVPLHG